MRDLIEFYEFQRENVHVFSVSLSCVYVLQTGLAFEYEWYNAKKTFGA